MSYYNGWEWLLFFYIYCFIGWCIESTIVSVNKRKLVNRGFLKGPMLPIYGSGAIMILICTLPVKNYIWLVYIMGMIGATILEYITGWGMEKILKVRYWDYSDQFLNLNGHICLKCSLFWGVLSIFMTYVIHKPIESVVLSMNPILLMVLVLLLSADFLTDLYYSAKAALDLAKILDKMKEIREELDGIAYQMKEGIQDSVKEFGEEAREELEDYMTRKQKELDVRIAVLLEEKEQIMDKLGFLKSQLIKANPTATARWYNGALEEIRERVENRLKEKKGK